MTALGIVLALAGALLAQTASLRVVAPESAPADLVLVVVVLVALSRGRVAGLWAGTCAGLLQDTLSGGVVGSGGFAKSITGVLAGAAGSRFIIGTVWQHFIILVLASIFHLLLTLGVSALVGATPAATVGFVLRQAAANGLFGVAALSVARAAPAAVERLRRSRMPFAGRSWST